MAAVFMCTYCTTFQCLGLRVLLNHIYCAHSQNLNFKIKCGVPDCPLYFNKYNSLYKHVVKTHKEQYYYSSNNQNIVSDAAGDVHDNNQNYAIEGPDNTTSEPNSNSQDESETFDDDNKKGVADYDDGDGGGDSSSNNNDDYEVLNEGDKFYLKKTAAKFILKIKERNKLSQTTLDSIIDSTQHLVSQVLSALKNNVEQTLESCDTKHNNDLSDVFTRSDQIFEGLRTENLQKSYIKEHFEFVSFKEVTLGNKIIKKKTGCSKYLLYEKAETFIYVPLLDSLRQFLSNSRIRALIRKPVNQSGNGVYYDICDGQIYKKDQYLKDNPNALLLILYHDEVEVCNPLGSKAGTHKLDMYYYTVANLDPKFRSKHCAVRLLAIVNAKLVSKYGVNKVLEPIIHDLKKLYEGVTFEINESRINVCGKVLLCAGDTLGQHLWGGFKEGVGFAFQKCRTCYCHNEDMQSKFDENDFKLRTQESYNLECKYLDEAPTEIAKSSLSTLYGINNHSILTELPGFDITKQLPQDIMHTILEGVLQYEVRLVLLYFIQHKYMTLSQMNVAIVNHVYGYSEISDKPGPLKESVFTGKEGYKLKYKAAQARLFLRILPFLLTQFIDTGDEYYQFLMELHQIVQTIYSPVIKISSIQNLRELITEHLTSFKLLFPEKTITPKQHYMIHIPSMIILNGPLIRSSCFAFESAHNYFKTLAQKQNYKHLTLSLAKRHQFLECSYFGDSNEDPSSHPLFSTEFKHGVLQKITDEMVVHLKESFINYSLLPGVELTSVHRLSWTMLYGTKYCRRGILAVGATQTRMLPIFGFIKEIWLVHGYVYFDFSLYDTLCFDPSFQAYLVEESTENFVCAYESLVDYNVFHLKFDLDGKSYVPVKYNIDDILEEHILGNNPLHS